MLRAPEQRVALPTVPASLFNHSGSDAVCKGCKLLHVAKAGKATSFLCCMLVAEDGNLKDRYISCQYKPRACKHARKFAQSFLATMLSAKDERCWCDCVCGTLKTKVAAQAATTKFRACNHTCKFARTLRPRYTLQMQMSHRSFLCCLVVAKDGNREDRCTCCQ
jgi:hypothetical protein